MVRSGAGVLGIFDDETVARPDRWSASVERGIADVSAAVPYAWAGSAVVYALSDDDFIAGLEPPQGTDPERLDGLAFSLPTGRQGEGVASTRIALHPRMVGRPGDPATGWCGTS